jgi:hypothetical protein
MKIDGLTYNMPHQTFYAEHNETPRVAVTYRSEDLSVQGSFQFEEHDFRDHGETAIELQMFADAWPLWMALPDLFNALALKQPITLEQVTAVLDLFGAEDTTSRDHPGRHGKAVMAMKAFRATPSPDNARAAAAELTAYADDQNDPWNEPPF